MESTIVDLETKAKSVSQRFWHYAHWFINVLRSNRRGSSVGPYRQDSILFGNSLWIGLGVVGWLLSRFLRERRRPYLSLSEKAQRHPPPQTSSFSKTKHAKSGRGLLSLAMELLGAVAISLGQRYAKSWS